MSDSCCGIQGDALEAPTTRAGIPLPTTYVPEAPRKITSDEHAFKAYRTLRDQRAAARYEGRRKIREAKVRATRSIPSVSFNTSPSCRRQRRRPTRRSKTLAFLLLISRCPLITALTPYHDIYKTWGTPKISHVHVICLHYDHSLMSYENETKRAYI